MHPGVLNSKIRNKQNKYRTQLFEVFLQLHVSTIQCYHQEYTSRGFKTYIFMNTFIKVCQMIICVFLYSNNLLVQSSLPSKNQSLNIRHSAAVDRQQSVGYELYAGVVSKTDRQTDIHYVRVQQRVGQWSNRVENVIGNSQRKVA